METIEGSSNGRMRASEARHEGSTPSPSATKLCNRCETEKPLGEFGKRGKGHQPWCKLCKNKWDRENYSNSKGTRREQIRNRALQQREENRVYVLSYLSSHPCVDCGESDFIVLEFDHLGDKEFNIGSAIGHGFSLRRIKEEIAKCEVVCCNCHRRRSNKRGNWWRGSVVVHIVKSGEDINLLEQSVNGITRYEIENFAVVTRPAK